MSWFDDVVNSAQSVANNFINAVSNTVNSAQQSTQNIVNTVTGSGSGSGATTTAVVINTPAQTSSVSYNSGNWADPTQFLPKIQALPSQIATGITNLPSSIQSGVSNINQQFLGITGAGVQGLPTTQPAQQAYPQIQNSPFMVGDQSAGLVAAINSPNPQAFGAGGITLNVPFGNQAQQQVNNINSVVYDKVSGGFAAYTTPYGHSISNIVTSGGAGSLQSGMFSIGSGNALTPVLYTQSGGYKGEFAPGANTAAAALVLANPQDYSRLGAERYGGFVTELITGEAGKLRAGIDVMGVYPTSSGNLANLVSQQGVNQSKSTWSEVPWSVPISSQGIFSVDTSGKLTAASAIDLMSIGMTPATKTTPSGIGTSIATKSQSDWGWGGDGTAPLPLAVRMDNAMSAAMGKQPAGQTPMVVPNQSPFLSTIPEGTPTTISKGGMFAGETTFGNMALSALSGVFAGAKTYVDSSQKPAMGDILSGKSTFGKVAIDYMIGNAKEQQPNPISTTPGATTNTTQSKEWFTGGNETISKLGDWITGTKPTIESMDAKIAAMSAGNVSGNTWTGSKEGYDTVTQMIAERNKLQEGFSANVTKYNTMSAENPIIKNTEMTTRTIGSTVTETTMQNPFETAVVSKVQGALDVVTGFVSKNPTIAGVVGMTSGSAGYGYVTAEAGYGLGTATNLGLLTTAAEIAVAAPVVVGGILGGVGVFVLENTGRLGLTGQTQEYSVRTAGEQYGKYIAPFQAELDARNTPAIQLSDFGMGARVQGFATDFVSRFDIANTNMKSPTVGAGAMALATDYASRAGEANKNVQMPEVAGAMAFATSLMGAGTGIFSGSETAGRAIYSEIVPSKSAYSEKPAIVNPTVEIPAQRRSIIEITDTGKPVENVIKNERANPSKTANEFIDALGVSYPVANPTRNPVSNSHAYDLVNGYPTKNPNENPNKNPFAFPSSFPDITRQDYTDKIITTTQTPTKTQVTNPYDIIRTYDYQQQMPRNPEPPKFKIDIPTLPNLGFPFGGSGGGGSGGSPKARGRGRYTDIYLYGQGISGGMFGSIKPLNFRRK